jgi:hypothetical protein
MTLENRKMTFGIEWEFGQISRAKFERYFQDRNFTKGFTVDTDASAGVTAEIKTCPLVPCQTSREFVQNLLSHINAIARQECSSIDDIVNTGCGVHVHIGNSPINDNVDPDAFCRASIEAWPRIHTDHAMPFDFEILRDVVWRYARMQMVINTMLARSRTDNNMCWGLFNLLDEIKNSNDMRELHRTLCDTPNGGKFSAITLSHDPRVNPSRDQDRVGTIEFRQHHGTSDFEKSWKWLEFICNLFTHTHNERMSVEASRTSVRETPSNDIFRRGSRNNVQYHLIRSNGGATTRDIMDQTGRSEQSVRRGISEIRDRLEQLGFDRSALVTHDQIANGHRYGDGTDLNGYQVLQTVETQVAGAELLPENRRGIDSIFAGLSDNDFEWWQGRIAHFAS